MGTFLLIAALWSAIPMGVAMYLASSRNESAASAVLLTLFFGWIGLAIVYFGQKRTLDAVKHLADAPAASTAPAPPDERLRRLEQLHRDGLLSDAEYASQRDRIIAAL